METSLTKVVKSNPNINTFLILTQRSCFYQKTKIILNPLGVKIITIEILNYQSSWSKMKVSYWNEIFNECLFQINGFSQTL